MSDRQHTRQPAQAEPSADRHVQAEAVRSLYTQATLGLATTLVLGLLLAFAFRDVDTPLALTTWVGVLLLTTLARWLLIATWRRQDRPDEQPTVWGRRFMLSSLAGGIVWGLAGYGLFPVDSMVHEVFLAVLLAGVTAGALPFFAPVAGVYECFLFPALLPYAFRLISTGDDAHAVIGTMVLIYSIVLWVTSSRIRETILRALHLRFENDTLVRDLLSANEQADAYNLELTHRIESQLSAERALAERNRILDGINQAQIRFIDNTQPRELFNRFLDDMLDLTQSEYGFIGEVLRRDDGSPYLRTHAITNIAWNDETRKIYDDNAYGGLEFSNLDTLFGHAITSGIPVIANNPGEDPRAGGLPPGHPPLNAFLGLPFFHGGNIIGMVGIANRSGGYDTELVTTLGPYLNTCANIVHTLRENTEKLRAEEELRSSESRLRSVLDNVTDGIVTCDTRGIIQSANIAAADMFAASESELQELQFRLLICANDRARFNTWLDGCIREHPLHDSATLHQFRANRANGMTFPLEIAFGRASVDGETLLIGICRDITERHRMDRMKSEFISTVSHELRTPLTSIRGSLGLLRSGSLVQLPDKAQTLINVADDNSARLMRLINDILDMDRIESGVTSMTIEELDLLGIIRDTVTLQRDYATTYNVSLEISEPGETPRVHGDRDRVQQVLVNLLSNAAKFSPRGGVVDISLQDHGEFVRLGVADRGPGIPEEFADQIFEKFTQLDSSDSRSFEGTGLGLSISKAMVEHMGGRIGFEARPGGGTLFTVDLRRAESPSPRMKAVT